jgi:hypothetical protein
MHLANVSAQLFSGTALVGIQKPQELLHYHGASTPQKVLMNGVSTGFDAGPLTPCIYCPDLQRIGSGKVIEWYF